MTDISRIEKVDGEAADSNGAFSDDDKYQV